MAQDFLCSVKSDFRRNTVCIARKSGKAENKKDKSDSASKFPSRSNIIRFAECDRQIRKGRVRQWISTLAKSSTADMRSQS